MSKLITLEQALQLQRLLLGGKVTCAQMDQILKDPQTLIRFFKTGRIHPILEVLPLPEDQIKKWEKANEQNGLGIKPAEFENIPDPPILTQTDLNDGYVGVGLFYGFPKIQDGILCDDVKSGELMLQVLENAKLYKRDQITGITDFKNITIRNRHSGQRPSGFFWRKVQLGDRYTDTKAHALALYMDDGKLGKGATFMCFEGLQFIAILMADEIMQYRGMEKNCREIFPFMLLADYAIYQQGYNYDNTIILSWDSFGVHIHSYSADECNTILGIPTLRP